MQKEVLRQCTKNLVFSLESVSESSTNSKAASSGVWNAKREVCRLQARNAELELQCGDLKKLKEKYARRDAKCKKVINDYNQLLTDFNVLAGEWKKIFEDASMDDMEVDELRAYGAAYKKIANKNESDANFLKHWVRDLKEEREALQRQIAAFQRREAILLALVPTATADRGYHTPARRGRGRGAART